MQLLDFTMDTVFFIFVLQNSTEIDSDLLIYKKPIITQLMLKNDLKGNAVIGASQEWKYVSLDGDIVGTNFHYGEKLSV